MALRPSLTSRLRRASSSLVPSRSNPACVHGGWCCQCSSLFFAVIAARSPLSLPRSFCATSEPAKMQNEEGQMMDLYIPRKCSATNRLITAKDHASIQVNVGHLDASGVYTGQHTTFALCGFIRAQGDGDGALDRLWQKKKEEVKQ